MERVQRSAKTSRPGIMRDLAQLLLDAEQLVVLGEPVGAGEAAGLDLPAIGGDGEVGDGRVLGLARAVRHDRGVAGAVRDRDRLERLGQRADLVDLDQDRIGEAALDAHAQPLRDW